jgi:hypothetical protein
MQQPPLVANNWYLPLGIGVDAGGVAVLANTAYLYPVIIPERCTIGSLAARVSTLHAGGLFDIALFNYDPVALNRPGTLVDKVLNLSTASTGPKNGALAGGNKQVEAGIYWVYFCTNDTTAIWVSCATTNTFMQGMLGSATLATVLNGTAMFQLTVAETQGTVPSDLTGVALTETAGATAQFPLVAYQPVSVP